MSKSDDKLNMYAKAYLDGMYTKDEALNAMVELLSERFADLWRQAPQTMEAAIQSYLSALWQQQKPPELSILIEELKAWDRPPSPRTKHIVTK